MLSFFLLGLLAVCCAHEACHESLTIYNFSKNYKKDQKEGGQSGVKDRDREKQSNSGNGLVNDLKYIMQLPLLWSVELVLIYVVLMMFNPNWVNIPLHCYFVLMGMQTLYSYINAKLSKYATEEISQRSQSMIAGSIVTLTVLCYLIHFIISSGVIYSNMYWISNNAIGYTLLIKLISCI